VLARPAGLQSAAGRGGPPIRITTLPWRAAQPVGASRALGSHSGPDWSGGSPAESAQLMAVTSPLQLQMAPSRSGRLDLRPLPGAPALLEHMTWCRPPSPSGLVKQMEAERAVRGNEPRRLRHRRLRMRCRLSGLVATTTSLQLAVYRWRARAVPAGPHGPSTSTRKRAPLHASKQDGASSYAFQAALLAATWSSQASGLTGVGTIQPRIITRRPTSGKPLR